MQITELIEEYQRLNLSESIHFDKFNLYSVTHHSTSIEGSTLTEIETNLLLDEGLTPKGKSLEHSLMTTDHAAALLYVIDEANQKIVNTIYLNELAYNTDTTRAIEYWYKYDSTEISQLENVAYQNPVLGGDAVFMARIMLFMDVIDLEMTKSLHFNNNNSNQNKVVTIYLLQQE